MKKFIQIVSCITILIFLRTGFALAADQVYYYYNDPAGTPMAMSDANGTVVWKADYMPFGEELLDKATVENNKMFVGKEKDKETGFYYFGARYMDSTAGRFISIDPKGPIDASTGKVNEKFLLNPQRLNRYSYAGNNPFAFVDFLGLDWILSQYSGRVMHIDNQTGKVTDYGIVAYSGSPQGLNNPGVEGIEDVGPIVSGTYTIGKMENIETLSGHKLKNAMRLEPDEETAAKIAELDRTGGFIWHGDNPDKWPRTSSTGCPISKSTFRKIVADSDDKTLKVVPIIPAKDLTWENY